MQNTYLMNWNYDWLECPRVIFKFKYQNTAAFAMFTVHKLLTGILQRRRWDFFFSSKYNLWAHILNAYTLFLASRSGVYE